jgi:hypothetical protein
MLSTELCVSFEVQTKDQLISTRCVRFNSIFACSTICVVYILWTRLAAQQLIHFIIPHVPHGRSPVFDKDISKPVSVPSRPRLSTAIGEVWC